MTLEEAVATIKAALPKMESSERKTLLDDIFEDYCNLCGDEAPCYCAACYDE